MGSVARLLASLALLWPSLAVAHQVSPRDDLDAIFAASSLVVRGEVVQVVAKRGSAGPTEVTILVRKALKGEAPSALTFAAAEEHGTRWVVRDRGFFFLNPHPRNDPPFVSVAWNAESPRFPGEGWKEIEDWLLAPERPLERIERMAASDSEPVRRHAASLLRGREREATADRGISLPGLLVAGAFSLGVGGLAWHRKRGSPT